MVKKVMNLGAVRITKDHNYRKFFSSILLALGSTALLVWMYMEGHVAVLYAGMGPYFTLGFAILFFLGMFNGLKEAWFISRAMDTIKESENEGILKLMKLFGIDISSGVDPELLKEEVRDFLGTKIDVVRYLANLAAVLGLAGTVYGLIVAFAVLGEIRGFEDVFKRLPDITEGVHIALYTTLVGIGVYVILFQMYRFISASALELKVRIFRQLNFISSKNQGGANEVRLE